LKKIIGIVNENDTEQRTIQLSEEALTEPAQITLNNGPMKNFLSEEIDIVVSSPKTYQDPLSHTMGIDHQQEDMHPQQKIMSEERQANLSTPDNMTKDTIHEKAMLGENLNMNLPEAAVEEASLVLETTQQESSNRVPLQEEESLHGEALSKDALEQASEHAEAFSEASFKDEPMHAENSNDAALVEDTLPAEALNTNVLIQDSVQCENSATCPAGTEGDMEVSHSDEDSSSLNFLVNMKMKDAKNEMGVLNTGSLEMKEPRTSPPTPWGLGDPGFFFSEECKTNCYPTILSTSHSGTNQVSKRHGVGKVLSSRILFPELPSIPHDGELAVVKPITKEDDFGFLSLFQHGHHSLLSWELLLQFLHVYLMWFRTIAKSQEENSAITSVASWSFFFNDETEGLLMHNIWETLYNMNTTFQLNLSDVVPLSHVLQITRIPNLKRTNHEFVKKLQDAIFATLNLNENDYTNQVWGPQYYIFAETERFRGNGNQIAFL
jgi:hypothetical protein